MPRYPETWSALSSTGAGPYSLLAHRVHSQGGPVYPLHIGDTWMEPPVECRMENMRVADHPGLHKYSPVQGRMGLRDAIAQRTRNTGDHPAERDEILVTAGATGGLYALMSTLCAPQDEVLVLAPYWPLIANAVQCAGAQVIPVPFFESADSPLSAIATLERYRTAKTVAVYWNTPHNPTGRLIPADWLEAMSQWAAKNELWIVSDEVYEHYSYSAPHSYTRPFAPERTIASYSFSKAYGMAGNRCGYLIGPKQVLTRVSHLTRNTFYSVTTASQIAAERALTGCGDAWAAQAAEMYQELGDFAAAQLGVARPQGSTFLFVDVSSHLTESGLVGFLEACAQRGLLVAPGSSFGPYPKHIRVCFTCAPPDVVRQGVEILGSLLT